MRGSFFAPPAELAEFQFPLNLLFIFGRIVVEPLALGTLKFY